MQISFVSPWGIFFSKELPDKKFWKKKFFVTVIIGDLFDVFLIKFWKRNVKVVVNKLINNKTCQFFFKSIIDKVLCYLVNPFFIKNPLNFCKYFPEFN